MELAGQIRELTVHNVVMELVVQRVVIPLVVQVVVAVLVVHVLLDPPLGQLTKAPGTATIAPATAIRFMA